MLDQLIQKAKTSFDKGDLLESQSICEGILKDHPNEPNSIFCMGSIYWVQERFEEAVIHLQKAIEIDPKLNVNETFDVPTKLYSM